jgi:Fur family transcriptional regulator, ferric uptake regulator
MSTLTKQHDCKTELREVNLKATPARIAVLKILEKIGQPLDVATIKSELKKNGINADPATVFRMMNSFSDKGIVQEINLRESKLRYEYTARTAHHHFTCDNCKSITDISDCNIEELQKNIQKKKGLLVTRHSLEFFGLCKDCQA